MPSDLKLANSDHTIMVVDRFGIRFPLKRGIMASGILATGIETPKAYSVAQLIHEELIKRKIEEISATELINLSSEILEVELGFLYASFFRMWQKIKNSGRPIVISISAASGIGKSTLATRLSLRLGINRVVTTDSVREVLRTVIPKAVLPELHVSSFEVIPNQVSDHLSTFQRQSHAVASASAAVAKRYILERKNIIIEGVHLLPGSMTEHLCVLEEKPIIVELLLSLSDKERHRNQLRHRNGVETGRNGAKNIENFELIRDIQAHLKDVAQTNHIADFDLDTNEDLTQKVIKLIIEQSGMS